MDAESVDAITRLVEAIANLARTLGSGWFALIVIGVTAIVFLVPLWREHRRNERADLVVQHKEKEIQRLAEDNRRYREVYLARQGVPTGILEMDRQDSKEAAAEREDGART